MPLYGYECEECGNQFELFKKFSNADDASGTECPLCEGKTKRTVNKLNFVKGPGYWADTK